jgi:hypothetical protein
MRMRIFYLVALLTLGLGLGAGAFAEGAKPAATAAATLAAKHGGNGVACKQCHGSGKPQPVATQKCVTCHDTKATAERTANVKPTNPHNSRHFGTEADCNSCHHQHKASQSLCADCHPRFNFKVP